MKCQPRREMEEIYGQCCCKDSGTCGHHWQYKS